MSDVGNACKEKLIARPWSSRELLIFVFQHTQPLCHTYTHTLRWKQTIKRKALWVHKSVRLYILFLFTRNLWDRNEAPLGGAVHAHFYLPSCLGRGLIPGVLNGLSVPGERPGVGWSAARFSAMSPMTPDQCTPWQLLFLNVYCHYIQQSPCDPPRSLIGTLHCWWGDYAKSSI